GPYGPTCQDGTVLTRRQFLRGVAGTAALAASRPWPASAWAAAAPAGTDAPFDHVVLLMMENRSFDHYLGWLPGADGRQAGLQFTDRSGRAFSTHRLAGEFQGCAFLDPDHSWEGGRTQLDRGKMDGFLRAHSDVFSIGYYTQQDLAFTPHVAQAFTAFDRFFCSLLSSTYPNREYMHAGQSFGQKENTIPTGT